MLFFWFSASWPLFLKCQGFFFLPLAMLCNSLIVLIYFYVQVSVAHSTFIESPTAECVSTSQWAFFPLYINNAIAAFFWINLLSSVPGDLPETWISKRPTSLARGDKGTMITPTGSGFPTQFCEWRKTRLSNAAASPGTSGAFQGPHSRED